MKEKDVLDAEYINSLPQPLWDRGYQIVNIDVQTGLYKIDVCGMIDIKNLLKIRSIFDGNGNEHLIEDLLTDEKHWINRCGKSS